MLNQKPPPEQLLALLAAAIRDAPTFRYGEPLSALDIRWLGKADALLEASGAISALISFRSARNAIGGYTHSHDNLIIPLHDAYSRLELLVPAAMQGAFIAGGDTWNGYAALVKLFQRECDDLLVVDPYLNSVIYTDLAPHSVASKGIRCLAIKRAENHPGLVASATKWAGDAVSREHPAQVRYAPPGTLHDRLIIIDSSEVWLVSQSLKDIAKKSPASVTRAEADLGQMKILHYEALWTQSAALTE